MRTGVAVATLLLGFGLAACGAPTPADRDASDDPTTRTEDPEKSAQRALADAVEAMEGESTRAFRVTTVMGQTTVTETEGAMVADGWESSSRFDDPTTSKHSDVSMKTVAEGGSMWMQVDWPGPRAGCWLTLETGTVPLGMLAMDPVQPTYLTLLEDLTAKGFTDGSRTAFHGELGLRTATLLMVGLVIEEGFQVDQRETHGPLDLTSERVPLMMGYDGHRVSGIALSGSDVLEKLDELGATVGKQERSALQQVTVYVNYPKATHPEEISAPPKNLQFVADAPGCR